MSFGESNVPLYTSCLPRPARKETNVPKLKCRKELTVLMYIPYLYCDFNVLVYELFFSILMYDMIDNCNRIGKKEFKTTLKSLPKNA